MIRRLAREKQPLLVEEDTIITPAAKDLIKALNIPVLPASAQEMPVEAPQPLQTPLKSLKVVGLAADHGGYELKEYLKGVVRQLGFEVEDYGTHSRDSVDYPDYAAKVAQLVSSGNLWRGIIIDGAGIGSSITANKFPGVRAALCTDVTMARNAREHNDANVLCLGAGIIGKQRAREIVAAWLETRFAGGRHQRRVDKIKAIEEKLNRKQFGY